MGRREKNEAGQKEVKRKKKEIEEKHSRVLSLPDPAFVLFQRGKGRGKLNLPHDRHPFFGTLAQTRGVESFPQS